MGVDSAHSSRWAIAEVVFGIPLLIGIAAQFIVPSSLPEGMLRQVLLIVGIALVVIGIAFIVLARREFARFGQPTDPGHPTSSVVKTGVFSISRNPLYLGCVILLCGVGCAINIFWLFVTLLLSIILCHSVLIFPEERYLAAKFGNEYKEYAARVHRWIGHT